MSSCLQEGLRTRAASGRPRPAVPGATRAVGLILLLGGVALPSRALAQEASERVWTNVAELSLVATSGNSESTTVGFKHVLTGKWERSRVELKLSAIRSESKDTVRLAVGDSMSFELRETSNRRKTAESYGLDLRHDREIDERHSWFVGAHWYRNEFAGVKNRSSLEVGVSQLWKDGPRTRFRTDESLTHTDQDDVLSTPGRSNAFAGLRLGWELRQAVGRNGTYGNDLVLDLNLDDTDDWRADMTNSLSVGFTDRLALKVGHQLLFDNQPAAEELPLFDPADLSTPIGKVLGELDDLDTVLTASLVLSF